MSTPSGPKAGPFGGTIAHGYLTLALVIPLFNELLEIKGVSMGVNYGLDKVRFPAPGPGRLQDPPGRAGGRVDEVPAACRCCSISPWRSRRDEARLRRRGPSTANTSDAVGGARVHNAGLGSWPARRPGDVAGPHRTRLR